MPIDWDEFKSSIGDIVNSAADKTDDDLAGRISSITRLTDDEVKSMFPEQADVKVLAELMSIVNSASDRNSKVNQIVNNAEKFGGVMLTLLGKFV